MRAHGQERARARCGTDPSSGPARCDRRWGMTGAPHMSATAGEGRRTQLPTCRRPRERGATRSCAGPLLGRELYCATKPRGDARVSKGVQGQKKRLPTDGPPVELGCRAKGCQATYAWSLRISARLRRLARKPSKGEGFVLFF
jgi:hypothetical protein